MNERAILYRKMEGIPDEWGTAVSVMAMVFGNSGRTSVRVFVLAAMPQLARTCSTASTL